MDGAGNIRSLFGDQQPVTIIEQAVKAAQHESRKQALQVQYIVLTYMEGIAWERHSPVGCCETDDASVFQYSFHFSHQRMIITDMFDHLETNDGIETFIAESGESRQYSSSEIQVAA
ncbi:hypothetical protein EV199_2421 [Pseudobacter ginsenosidimutans]|jgi:hypothetical protein|uniref:Uncharacterized protein n=1 Tax=Pseudobacter ginsenosidimutans TaxID=661488 RepID=A0A4Q7N639_9BACT|nr:hypothetical protein EV199_2421 [Pseudobacter ginsenosidimutans]